MRSIIVFVMVLLVAGAAFATGQSEEGDRSGEVTTVRWWDWADSFADYIRAQFEAFEAANPDIEIEGFGRRVGTASGMTDADLEFRDRRSGVRYRAEIKEVQPTNFERTKATAQIDKMVEDGRRTGRRPIYVNRHGVPAWLQEYAAQKGVPVYQNVVTGEKSALRSGNLSLEDVGNDLQKSKGRIGRSELAVNRTSKGARAWGRAIGRGGAIVAVTISVVEGGCPVLSLEVGSNHQSRGDPTRFACCRGRPSGWRWSLGRSDGWRGDRQRLPRSRDCRGRRYRRGDRGGCWLCSRRCCGKLRI